ncbi:MAG: 50S ribosomal protein L11 methyltransferase [Deltaproteobacteria bacterium]|nr:50S ribosomal protein L11 methyltransferase [Deltaproteobacteria bacterium]
MTSVSKHPGWLEIAIDINPIAHEAVGSFLVDLGCEGVAFEDNGGHGLKAYLPVSCNWEDIYHRIKLFLLDIKEIFPEADSSEFSINKIENEDWGISWHKFFRPDQVTEKLLILPAWEPVPSRSDSHIIRIDPGTAFGTGQHASTRLCLEAMEMIRLPGRWSLLDVGTGSGILAIYGVKLGADRVAALDIDPEAIRWGRKNIELNVMTRKIELSEKSLDQWDEKFTLVTANLILSTILELCPHFLKVLAPRAWLILSGILREQLVQVKEAFSGSCLKEEFELFQEEWACLVLKNE